MPEASGAISRNGSPQLDQRSRDLRRLVLDGLEGGGRGHVGSSMSLIEILRVLYDEILNYRAGQPDWEERDRCILSKGHGCLALYAVLADKGFFDPDLLRTFCHPESTLGGHPERGVVPGVEVSTGALGHGLAVGVGICIALRLRNERGRVFVILGDGELNEGSVWESAMVASKHGLDHLTVIVDYNKMQSYGSTEFVQPLEPLADKWRAFGFATVEVDGHDVIALENVLRILPQASGRPSAIIAHTIKGKGISIAEQAADWHHKSRLSDQEVEDIRAALECG